MKYRVTITTTKEKVKIVKADSLEIAREIASNGGGKTVSRSNPSRSYRIQYADPACESPLR